MFKLFYAIEWQNVGTKVTALPLSKKKKVGTKVIWIQPSIYLVMEEQGSLMCDYIFRPVKESPP